MATTVITAFGEFLRDKVNPDSDDSDCHDNGQPLNSIKIVHR